MVGTAVDLVLLDHYEDTWQLVPLVLLGIALGVVCWVSWTGGWTSVVALRVTMILFVAAGFLGVLLHYNGNKEFQQEIDPSLAGWPLFVKIMTAKAPPALAPGAMIQLGMLGLLFTYRHPALAHPAPSSVSQDSTGA